MEKGGSKLMQMQARFQQKQLQERELKIASLYEAQQARALTRVRHSPSESLASPPQPPTAPHQPGKVRQMFEERRTKGIDKSYPLQPIHNTERNRKPLPNGFTKVTSNRVQNGTEKKEHRQNGMEKKEHRQNGTRVTSRVVEKKSTSRTHVTQSLTKHHVKSEEVVNNSGDLNHNHQVDMNAVKEALSSSGLVTDVDELDGDGDMLEDETFPEALAPVTPREEPPARPPRRSPATKTTVTKPKPAPAPAAPPRRTPSGNVSVSKSHGSMAHKTQRATPVASSAIRSTPGSSHTGKRMPAAPSSTGVTGDGAPCAVCGRRFAADRLATHEAICRRAQNKKRKPFDALKHRLAGTEAEPFISKLRKSTNAAPAKAKPLNNNWRQKHEEFIQAIRAAKQVQQHLAAGGKLSDLPPPPPSENPDYVPCPHCGRRFNQSAAERHIPKCASYQFNKTKPGQAKPNNSKRR